MGCFFTCHLVQVVLDSSIRLASPPGNSYRHNISSPSAAFRGIPAERPPGPAPSRRRSARWTASARGRRASGWPPVASCPARRSASWDFSGRASWSRDTAPTRCRRSAPPDSCPTSRTGTAGPYRSSRCSCNSEDRRTARTTANNRRLSGVAADRRRGTRRSRPRREPVGCRGRAALDGSPVVSCRSPPPEPCLWKELRRPAINSIKRKKVICLRYIKCILCV